MLEQSAEFTVEKLQGTEGVSELNRLLNLILTSLPTDGADRRIFQGYGTPESQISAGVGSIFMRLDGGAGTTIYAKESGSSDTGWSAL